MFDWICFKKRAPYDHHAVAVRIMDELDRIGCFDWKKRLDDAIAGGSTGTEILFSLRGNLVNMLKPHNSRRAK